jgi:uncharacterized membrane protein
MQNFISQISKQKINIETKISISSIRNCIVEEIKKDFPNINVEGYISVDELNIYREKYIQNILKANTGELNNLQQQVAQHLKEDEFISDHLMDDNKEAQTYGQKLADKVATFGGSWTFISCFGFLLIAWIIINSIVLVKKPFDPYPFILLNLILSCIAAIQAPVIMMSQNRQEEKDRERAKNDYMINLKSEVEIRMLHEKIDHIIMVQQQKLMEVQQLQVDMLKEILEHSKK